MTLEIQEATLGDALLPGFLEAGRQRARHFGPVEVFLLMLQACQASLKGTLALEQYRA